MNLWKLTFKLDREYFEHAEKIIEPHAEAISYFEMDDEIDWKIEAYFLPHYAKNFLEETLIANIQKEFSLKLEDILLELLPRVDWLAQSYASFPPLVAGRFYVHGSHARQELPSGLIPLEINAATAFGSGEHQSTYGCLLALSELSKKIKPTKILDMGTGTGILALAAAKLFKKRVLAVDCDGESVRVCQENAHLNGIAPLMDAYHGQGYKSQKVKNQQFDLIFANILARPLVSMAPDLAQALAPNGFAILAGLLNRQENMVLHAHLVQGLRLYKRIRLGDWTCLILSKSRISAE